MKKSTKIVVGVVGTFVVLGIISAAAGGAPAGKVSTPNTQAPVVTVAPTTQALVVTVPPTTAVPVTAPPTTQAPVVPLPAATVRSTPIARESDVTVDSTPSTTVPGELPAPAPRCMRSDGMSVNCPVVAPPTTSVVTFTTSGGYTYTLDVQSPNTGTLTRTYDGVTPRDPATSCDVSDPAGASVIFDSSPMGENLNGPPTVGQPFNYYDNAALSTSTCTVLTVEVQPV